MPIIPSKPGAAAQRCSVAVIGAGAAGLVACRELRREGHTVVAFEQGPTIGGVWAYNPATDDDAHGPPQRLPVHGSMYAQLRTNLPRELMAFGDFPMDSRLLGAASTDARRFCSHAEVQAYLEAFAAYYQLNGMVRTLTRVVSARPMLEKQRQPREGGSSAYMASGAAAGGAEREKRSSAELRGWPAAVPLQLDQLAAAFAGDDQPVTVGCGPAWELEMQAVQADASGHLRPTGTAPTMQRFDALVVANGHYSVPNWPDIPGEATFPGRVMHSHSYRTAAPFAGQAVLLVGASNSGEDLSRELSSVCSAVYLCARAFSRSVHAAAPAGNGQPQPQKATTTAPPQQPQPPHHADGSAAAAAAASATAPCSSSGRIQRLPMLARLCEDGSALLDDGTRIPRVDAVIYCTGYRYSFPFLEAADGRAGAALGVVRTDDQRVAPLWQHMYPLESSPTLCFIGLPWKVAPFPQFELQAKLAARVLSGALSLPSRAQMAAEAQSFYRSLAADDTPARHSHMMGHLQWAYNDFLSDTAAVARLPAWRMALYDHVRHLKASYPERYRDEWDDPELLQRVHGELEGQVEALLAQGGAEYRQWLKHAAAGSRGPATPAVAGPADGAICSNVC